MKDGGAPVAGARIFLNRNDSKDWLKVYATTTSDAVGNFELSGLAPGSVRLSAKKESLVSDVAVGGELRSIMLADVDSSATVVLEMVPGTIVRGMVVSSVDKAPVPDAIVAVYPMFGEGSSTDSEGRFALITRTNKGTQQSVNAAKEGWVQSENVTISWDEADPQAPEFLDVALTMEPTTMISGRVLDAVKLPVEGVSVSWRSQTNWKDNSAKTDAEGKFNLGVKRGDVGAVHAKAKDGRFATSRPVTPGSAASKVIEIILEATGSIQGKVVDEKAKPIADANVGLRRLTGVVGSMRFGDWIGSTKSGPDGRFEFLNVAPGDLDFTAGGKGYASGESPIKLKPGEALRDVVIVLKPGFFVAGRVVGEDDAPIEGAFVTGQQGSGFPSGSGGLIATDKDGRFRMEGLRDEDLALQISSPQSGLRGFFRDVKLNQEDAKFVLKEQEKAEFIGTVVDAKTEEPIADFRVNAKGQDVTKAARRDMPPGKFKVMLEKEYSQAIRVSAPGYAEVTSGWINPGEAKSPIEHRFEMRAGRSISGRIIDAAAQQPVPDVAIQIELEEDGSFSSSARTAEDGRFTVANQLPGRYRIRIQPEKPYAARNELASLPRDRDLELGDLPLTKGGSIFIRVVGGGMKPLAEKTVTLDGQRNSAEDPVLKTDEAGVAHFKDVASGSYEVKVKGSSTSALVEQLNDGEDRELTLAIGSATLRGSLRKGGKPTKGFVRAMPVVGGTAQRREIVEVGSSGNFVIEDLPTGFVQIDVFRSQDRNVAVLLTEELEFNEGEEKERIFKIPASSIAGAVLDAQGNPVKGANVTAHRSGDGGDTGIPRVLRQESGDEGVFSFGDVASGDWLIHAAHPDHGKGEQRLTARENSIHDAVIVELVKSGGTLESVALRFTDSEPIQRAWLRLWDASGAEHSATYGRADRDATGLARIEHLKPGRYRTQVSYWGHSEANREIEIREGEVTTIEDVLYEAGSMKWNLALLDGRPLVGADITVVPVAADSIEKPRSGRSNNAGAYEARGLFPGSYTATAKYPGGTLTHTFLIRASGHTEQITKAP